MTTLHVRFPNFMKILRCNFQYSVAPKECTTGSREQEVITEGRKEGRKEKRKEGREGGREKGRREGRKEGRKEGGRERRNEGRKEGKEKGRKGGRKEGGKGGRKEVKYVIPIYFTFNKTLFRITQVDIREIN